jgi:hypothetical protein
MQITKDQQAKAAKKIEGLMLAARRAFVAAHPEYKDAVLNQDDVRYLASLATSADAPDRLSLSDATAKAIEKTRHDFVLAGRDVSTLDILATRTEKAVPEAAKYAMLPWLGAKRYSLSGQVYKAGYQDPEAMDRETPNAFLTSGVGAFQVPRSEGAFQVLRSKGIFQLLSEDEISDFTKSLDIGFDLYFSLFY